MLKYHLKKARLPGRELSFTEGLIPQEKELTLNDSEFDALQSLLTGNFEDGVNTVLIAIAKYKGH